MTMHIADFNLDRAKAGARLVTRSGFPVEIYTFCRRSRSYPVVGVIRYPDYDMVTTWAADGRAAKLNRPHDNDLMILEEDKSDCEP